MMMTIQQLLQCVQDYTRPVKGIQFYHAQLSLRGRDIAGTCIDMFIIISRYVFCDPIAILLQNIYFGSRRFLTYFHASEYRLKSCRVKIVATHSHNHQQYLIAD